MEQEMTKKELYALIEKSIKNNRAGVIAALNKSYVRVNPQTSDKELLYLIEREFINANGFLVFHLGQVMQKELSMSGGEMKSNWAWVAQVAPLLGGLLGGGKKDAPPPPQNNQSSQMMQQFMMAQQQAQADAQRREDRRREEEARRRSTNTMVFAGVGLFAVVIGVVLYMNKK